MNTLKNSIQLIGNLGNEIEFKEFDAGSKKRVSFSLATNDYYKNNKGEKIQDTQWHNIVAWGKTAELMNNLLSKGSQVLVKGKLTSRSYENKKGETRYISEIVANEFVSFDKKEMPF